MNGIMMNFDKYRKTLSIMPQPIMPSENPKVKLDISGIIKYAKEKGVKPVDLSKEEKDMFIEGDYESFYEHTKGQPSHS